MVIVNGEGRSIAGIALSEYLETTDYDPGRIAVERNGEIVPRKDYGSVILKDEDRIEIVGFVGGG